MRLLIDIATVRHRKVPPDATHCNGCRCVSTVTRFDGPIESVERAFCGNPFFRDAESWTMPTIEGGKRIDACLESERLASGLVAVTPAEAKVLEAVRAHRKKNTR